MRIIVLLRPQCFWHPTQSRPNTATTTRTSTSLAILPMTGFCHRGDEQHSTNFPLLRLYRFTLVYLYLHFFSLHSSQWVEWLVYDRIISEVWTSDERTNSCFGRLCQNLTACVMRAIIKRPWPRQVAHRNYLLWCCESKEKLYLCWSETLSNWCYQIPKLQSKHLRSDSVNSVQDRQLINI